jgi:benzylsuccinate CoA-transferase BbsE subunit
MLSPYRCIDLTDEAGQYCGKVLADLGCDVIKVEKPAGEPARSVGPFYHGIPDPEKSLFWFANNTNKRSITLNIETTDGHEIFERLVKGADFLIESFKPGYMDSLGLGYTMLSKVNPQIIMTSITPFGQTGPYKDYKGSDIVVTALSGYMYISGEPGRPPLCISTPQAFLHASTEAAEAILIALYHREETGEGQYIDVSAQQSLIWLMMAPHLSWLGNQDIYSLREGNVRVWRGYPTRTRLLFPCKDGFVCLFMFGGHPGARGNRALMEWMDSEGMSDDYLNNICWEEWEVFHTTQEDIDHIEGAITRFFLTRTKEELFLGARERGLILAPVFDIKAQARHPQLDFRGFWIEVEHPELGETLTYPSTCFESSLFPRRVPRRAPLIGEHNEEVYTKELGLNRQQLAMLKRSGVI